MSEQDRRQAVVQQRPTTNDQEAWKAYWEAQGQSWRTEPEIDAERQKYLEEQRVVVPDTEKGFYPFRKINLSRADVEWLLATHENGRGPIAWSDEDDQPEREGLDLRGAHLERVDLSSLPLARIRGGLTGDEWINADKEQREMAAAQLQEADLSYAELQGANLGGAQMQGANLGGADLSYAELQEANLRAAQMQGADLSYADLEGVTLIEAQMQEADLHDAYLQRADLWGAKLQEADLSEADLERVTLIEAQMQEADLSHANLQGANLFKAQMQKADLSYTKLQRANLPKAQLQEVNLYGARLQEANFTYAKLQGADLRRTYLERVSLEEVILSDEKYGATLLADIQWGEVNLTVIDWNHMTRLGDEIKAQQKKDSEGKRKDKQTRISEYKEAVRAYRQLSVVLHNQGLNEDAARFSYHAQFMQRKVFWHQGIRSSGKHLFSLFLDLLTGYGYKPIRSFITYAVVISVFAFIYFLLGSHLTWNEAIVISMTAFHGRGFFPEQFKPSDPQALVAAIEAFVGLLIEVTFIATLTQRLFGK